MRSESIIFTMLRPRKNHIYWPGEINSPCFPASCAHPPASASLPAFALKSFTRFSSSGRKCRIRPWMGQAKASPRAIAKHQHMFIKGRTLAGPRWGKIVTYRKSYVPPPASSTPAAYRSPWPSPCPFSKRFIIWYVHVLPSLQGVHWPHDSCL